MGWTAMDISEIEESDDEQLIDKFTQYDNDNVSFEEIFSTGGFNMQVIRKSETQIKKNLFEFFSYFLYYHNLLCNRHKYLIHTIKKCPNYVRTHYR